MTKDNLKFWGTIIFIILCAILFFDSMITRCSFEKYKEENIELKEEIEIKEKEDQIDSINYKIEDIKDSIKMLEKDEKVHIIPDVNLDSLERWIQPDGP